MHIQWQFADLFETTARWLGHFSVSEFFGIATCVFIVFAIAYREAGENRRNAAREDRRSLKSSARNAELSKG
jgi:hypothetical protein